MNKVYKAHCENLRTLKDAISEIERTLRLAIAKRESNKEFYYTRILSQLISNCNEVQLYKLLEENIFNSSKPIFETSEKKLILGRPSLAEKWRSALSLAICKGSQIPITIEIEQITKKLIPTHRFRYTSLLECIDNELLNSIQIRNKIAHGQWKYAFDDKLTQISTELTGSIRKENIVTLQLRQKILDKLCQLIRDASISPKTFVRDFDMHFIQIENQRNNIHKRNYLKYKQNLINRFHNGILKKEKAK
ncbi:hypothetical protein EHQ94_00125 [Leptospira meyeri]|uniref:hypothetical protein n=1 Tax=Leptospira meyeri TaxID=29508 RepID=UPI0010829B32|nr:hypothetical protein [Leptospira meyeri]TGM68300.1 hypothetical protein EHQ93_00310 [Leptospira meyeri]TGM73982.1 hypothetical protein EHQ94_00125 [Leptospira meyeri]